MAAAISEPMRLTQIITAAVSPPLRWGNAQHTQAVALVRRNWLFLESH